MSVWWVHSWGGWRSSPRHSTLRARALYSVSMCPCASFGRVRPHLPPRPFSHDPGVYRPRVVLALCSVRVLHGLRSSLKKTIYTLKATAAGGRGTKSGRRSDVNVPGLRKTLRRSSGRTAGATGTQRAGPRRRRTARTQPPQRSRWPCRPVSARESERHEGCVERKGRCRERRRGLPGRQHIRMTRAIEATMRASTREDGKWRGGNRGGRRGRGGGRVCGECAARQPSHSLFTLI